MRIILKILKWIGIVILVLIVLIVALLFWLSKKPSVPTNYTKTVKTDDTLEAKYLAMGEFEVSHTQADAPDDWKTYSIYYPTILETSTTSFPVVVAVNGTGVAASKYPALFQHLASWGFVVIGNENPSTCSGDSADASLAYLLKQNDTSDSIFYQKLIRLISALHVIHRVVLVYLMQSARSLTEIFTPALSACLLPSLNLLMQLDCTTSQTK